MVLLRPATAHLTFNHPLNWSFNPEGHIHMDKDRVDQNDGRRRVNQQRVAHNLNREIRRKVRTPDNDPGHQQHKNHAHDAPEHHLLPGVIFANLRDLMLIAFQNFDNPQHPRNILFIRDVMVHKADEHKHQHHENQHAEERMQNAPHLRSAEGFSQPLQRREEKRNPRDRHQEETDNHRPVTGAIDKLRAHNHFRLTHGHPPLRHHPLLCSDQYQCSDR